MNSPRVSVVMTTINARENTAIPEYERVCKELNWDLLVIGDMKTPDMELEHGKYYSPEDQMDTGFKLAGMIPWNCYGRKNIGYLIAYNNGSDYIISTDDDNYPLDNYHTMIDMFNTDSGDMLIGGDKQFLNYLEYFNNTTEIIWPRGLPLGSVWNTTISGLHRYNKEIGIVAGLWNGSPDFDAIGHMLYDDKEWTFKENKYLFKTSGMSPYNTQNTVISREVLPMHFLPIGIGRADDIWTSYISQLVLTMMDKGVLYVSPTVYQKRNKHDYIVDMKLEKKVLLESEELIEKLSWTELKKNPIDYYANLSYSAAEFISSDHIKHVKTWLEDLGV